MWGSGVRSQRETMRFASVVATSSVRLGAPLPALTALTST
jgi:hypothetical protein